MIIRKLLVRLCAFAALAALSAAVVAGCSNVCTCPPEGACACGETVSPKAVEAIRVGSYNIRLSGKYAKQADGPNYWDYRKADLVAFVKKLDLDAFGMQEVCPDEAQYLRENLPDYEFVGDHREADRVSGEASPVFYRKSRFEAERSGTFWLSETPDVPGLKGWGAACPRVCSYLVLKDRKTGKRLCFANTHTDHVSALAREKGMLLIIERMREFGQGAPIVFTGDHNCCYDEPPAVAVRRILKDARDVCETPLKGPRNTFQGFGRYKDGPVNRRGETKDYCIDYIYVSEGARVLDFATHDDRRPGTDLYPSDHFPVSATVVLP